MLLETEKESVCINQIVGQKKDEIIVEGDVIVNDVKPDVLNIISADGLPCVYKKEVMDGKVRLDGSINTYIIYLADSEDSAVRSLNTVLDFTEVIDIENDPHIIEYDKSKIVLLDIIHNDYEFVKEVIKTFNSSGDLVSGVTGICGDEVITVLAAGTKVSEAIDLLLGIAAALSEQNIAAFDGGSVRRS